MKNILFILFSIVLLCSCNQVRTLQKTNVNTDVKSVVDISKKVDEEKTLSVSDNVEISADVKNDQRENEYSETETKVINYDTSKPIVPQTGKPPILSETTIINKKGSEKNNNSVAKTTQKSVNQTEYKDNSEITEHNIKKDDKTQVEKIEIKKEPILLTRIIIYALIACFIWIIIKFKWYNVLSFIWRKKIK